jgi:hypothetical protein
VDANGVVIDDSAKRWICHIARETPLAPAMNLGGERGSKCRAAANQSADGAMLFGAYPFPMGSRGTGWVLIIFDRADAVAQAAQGRNPTASNGCGWSARFWKLRNASGSASGWTCTTALDNNLPPHH